MRLEIETAIFGTETGEAARLCGRWNFQSRGANAQGPSAKS